MLNQTVLTTFRGILLYGIRFQECDSIPPKNFPRNKWPLKGTHPYWLDAFKKTLNHCYLNTNSK